MPKKLNLPSGALMLGANLAKNLVTKNKPTLLCTPKQATSLFHCDLLALY